MVGAGNARLASGSAGGSSFGSPSSGGSVSIRWSRLSISSSCWRVGRLAGVGVAMADPSLGIGGVRPGQPPTLTGTRSRNIGRVCRCPTASTSTARSGPGASPWTARRPTTWPPSAGSPPATPSRSSTATATSTRPAWSRSARSASTCDVTGVATPDRELGFLLHVASALPKGDRGDFLIEKLTELGATDFTPLLTERGVVRADEAKADKLRRAVIEASKQCGRNVLLRVHPPARWLDWVRETDRPATHCPSGRAVRGPRSAISRTRDRGDRPGGRVHAGRGPNRARRRVGAIVARSADPASRDGGPGGWHPDGASEGHLMSACREQVARPSLPIWLFGKRL